MTLEEALTARIAADKDLRSVLAEEGGWSMRLVGTPGLTLQIAADPRPQHMKGLQRVRQTTVQADAWGTTKDEAVKLRERLIVLLCPPALVAGVQFQRAQIASVRTLSVPEQSGERQRYRGHLARESIDFIFTHNAN